MSATLAATDPFALLAEPKAEPKTETQANPQADPKPEPPVTSANSTATPTPTPAPAPTRTTKKAAAKPQIAFLDIETVPDFSRAELFGLAPIPQPAEYMEPNDGPAPSELIKPTVDDTKAAIAAALSKANGKKIRREIAEACIELEKKSPKPRKGVIDIFSDMVAAIDGEAQVIADAVAANNKTMAVCPEMNKIVAVGWAIGDEPEQSLVVGAPHLDGSGVVTEADVLDRIWTVISSVSGGPVCGFNVIGFDLPTIFVRSAINKIKPRRKLDLKPWGGDVLDLMAVRYPKGQPRGLGWLSKVNGIKSEVPDVDGSKVGELYAAGEYDKIGQYVRDDVHLTRSYHRMYAGFFWS